MYQTMGMVIMLPRVKTNTWQATNSRRPRNLLAATPLKASPMQKVVLPYPSHTSHCSKTSNMGCEQKLRHCVGNEEFTFFVIYAQFWVKKSLLYLIWSKIFIVMVMRKALELNLGRVLICKIIVNVYYIFSLSTKCCHIHCTPVLQSLGAENRRKT